MKWKKMLCIALAAMLFVVFYTGCGASGSAAPENGAYEEMMEAPADQALGAESAGAPTALPENRKWVVTIHLEAETEDLDAMLASVFDSAAELQGYVEDQNIYNGSEYSGARMRSAGLTVRIPAEQADAFVSLVASQGNVVSNNKSLEDITLQYVDTETRMEALETEEARLLELMEQAETMADLLEIEARLTDVRYEKERVASQLRTYDNQVNYATIYLSIEEVVEYSPVEEPTVWQRISRGFVGSVKGVLTGLLDFMIFLIIALPYLLVWGGIITGIVFLIRSICKKKKKKKQPPVNPQPPVKP